MSKNIVITNEEYEKIVQPKLNELIELNEGAPKIARAVIGETLFGEDLYFSALLDKSMKLTDGFIEMIKIRNLTCAGILLRSCLDNCLRLYAMLIAKDVNKVVDCIVKGERIDQLKDKDGSFLRDGYLKKKLNKYDHRFKQVYDNASGYVHFSEKAFYQSASTSDESEKWNIHFQVSHLTPEKANLILIECVDAYIHFLKLYYSMYRGVILSKINYDKNHEDITEEG